jgi:hypothetical protein
MEVNQASVFVNGKNIFFRGNKEAFNDALDLAAILR